MDRVEPPPQRAEVNFTQHRWAARATGALLAAALMAAAECIPGLAWLVLLALTPLCLVLRGEAFLEDFTALAVFNGAFTAFTTQWIRLTGSGFTWFLLAAVVYEMLLAAIPAAGLWLAGRRGVGKRALLLLPVFLMFLELLSRRAFFGISWALIGLPLADYPPVAQVAAIAGPEALTFLAVAVNVALALAFQPERRLRRWAAIQAAGLTACALTFGLTQVDGGPEAVTPKIAVVQPMISQQTRWDRPENRPPLLARMNRLIDAAAAQSPRLIVLPEAALPGLVHRERDLADFATGAVERTGRPILFGSVTSDQSGNFYNTAIRIGTDGAVDEYRKRRLVPFVEHTPWPFHYTPPDGWVQFTPGDTPAMMPLGAAWSFAVAMCLEDTYPDLARQSARSGANLLIAMINTENFKGTSQALAHLRRARLTAIAAGIPILRAANSGISCSIDAHGRLLGSLPANRESAEALPVSTWTVPTVYGTVGDAGVLAMLALWLGLAALAMRAHVPAVVLPPRKHRRRGRRRSAAPGEVLPG